jgi:hypothetical protein
MTLGMSESESASGRHAWWRFLSGVVALPTTVFALLAFADLSKGGLDPLRVIIALVAATLAVLSGWLALRGHLAESRARMKLAIAGGLILGAVGFAAGFFGPILLTPGANQGPLLGIFVTGPLGFVLGVPAGWIYARVRSSVSESARA